MLAKEFNKSFPLPVPAVKDRETCRCCGKPMPIWKWDSGTWRYRGYGHFCTLRCCETYANGVMDLMVQKKVQLIKFVTR